MRILKIEIESFGKLDGFVLEPARGITLIEGENESGKSTLLAFLRFAFYGFPRKNALDGEERDKRISWQTKTAAGRLTLEWHGGVYRIARRCVARSVGARESFAEELSVVMVPEEREVSLDGKTAGEYFLSMPAELYDGSLSLIQSDADRVSAMGVGEAVGDLLFGGEALLSAEAAENRLQAARRELQHAKGRGGRLAELEDELSLLDGALVTAREEQGRLEELHDDLVRYKEQMERKKRELALVTSAFEGAQLDRTLALLDDLRAAREEEARCRAQWESVGRRGAAELPEKELLARMTAALEELAEARQVCSDLTPEAEQLEKVHHDDKLLRGAAYLEKMGGRAEKLPKKVAQLTKRKRAFGVLAFLCALLGTALFGLGYLMIAYRVPCYVGGAFLLVSSVIWFVCALIGRHRIGRIMLAVGAQAPAMLRTHLEQCKREAASYRAHTVRLTELRARLTEAEGRIDAAQRTMRAALDACGCAETEASEENVRAYLSYALRHKGELQAALNDAIVAYERAKSAREVLERRTEGLDENALRARRDALSLGSNDFETLPARKSFLEEALAGLEQKHAATAKAESALTAVAKDPAALSERRRAVESELAEATERLAAIRMASDALSEAVEEMRQQITPRLCESAARLFDELTDGAHGTTLRVTDDLSVSLEGVGIPRPISHFSAGCRDAAHLSLRLALLETVSNERLPLFFDEAFSRLDDRRTAAFLRVLERYAKGGGQCLLFTCHSREGRMLTDESALRVRLP